MKIGIVQINPVAGDLESNAATLLNALRTAASRGAELAVASELALCGHPPTDLLLRESYINRSAKVLQSMAETMDRLKLPPLLLGAPVANPVLQGKNIHNGAVLLGDGKVVVVSRKILLPNEGIRDDGRYFEPGVACGMVQYKGWRLAVTIGEDIRNDRTFWQGRRLFDQDPVAEFMTGGADGLINLTALPYRLGGASLHERMLAWSAVRYRIPIICVNQAGGQDALIYEGKSVLVNSFGQVTARAASFSEDVMLVDLVHPGDSSLEDPLSPEADIWQALVTGTRDFVRKCGLKKALLGLSGGIDSALVAAVAVDALGPENVLGVLLPSPYTSELSITAAEALGRNLGIQTQTIPIREVMQSAGAALGGVFAGLPQDLTEENIQARIRCLILMALSNKFGHMVLETGNKSEIAVGYCTLYGDTCGGLSVIGDIYKTQVYELARWLNSERGRDVIPECIISRPPSAELRPDQKDEDSLPPYAILDALLRDHIEKDMDQETLCEVGHDPSLVKRVLNMVRNAEFKRHQSPPTLRVSPRAFGDGWRMPIARNPLEALPDSMDLKE